MTEEQEQINQIDDLLARINTGLVSDEDAGNFIVVYGPAKVGKTSMLVQAPDTLLVECKDNSSEQLKKSGAIPAGLPVFRASGWVDAITLFWKLSEGGHQYKHVVVDGGTGLSEWADQMVIDADPYSGDREKFLNSFGRGDRKVNMLWQDLIAAINEMKAAGIWVYLICHRATVTEKNALGSDYMRNVPAFGSNKDKVAQVVKFADALLFIDFLQHNTEVNKLNGVAKVRGGDTRVMHTSPQASYEAGGRLGLKGIIELGDSPVNGLKAFRAALKEAGWKPGAKLKRKV